ncbi:hypothetical protein Aph01nite_43800 [Acrocarpospora phusangensis]|uniref:Uncharacterized protein n=1 Tax=Acrocarpospora phusangensis TaxID=1070424 RepID=A0A919QET5_9ACTN|nr:hypothetical protein [Acrocarpospora phusangensis]GIH26070.1 hypothetical protein Aph01nite_43800 [Acrocarpospora phusangensis]
MTLRPHSELVAVAWLRDVPGVPDGAVGTTLPGDASKWPDGFLQVSVVGGDKDRDIPVHKPVLQIDAWYANQGSKPSWGRANQLLEMVAAHCWSDRVGEPSPSQRPVTLPSGYQGARVQAAMALTDPRRVPADEARYAHYEMDLALHWVAIP